MQHTIMLASSDPFLIKSVRGVLSGIEDLRVEVVATIGAACDALGRDESLLVIAHLDGIGGVADVARLQEKIVRDPRPIPTLAVVDHFDQATALAILKMGVTDYLTRPLDLGRLAYLIDVLTLRARRLPPRPLPTEPSRPDPDATVEGGRRFIYSSTTELGRIMEQIRRVAPLESTILLGGETGTGKTQLAGLIHRLSPRRGEPFLTINCGAMAANLVESEMFGHVKGAFTGAVIDRIGKFAEVGRGTLFFDEVDSLPLDLQAKLLHAVEERVFEPVGSNRTQAMRHRLIAACNRPLEAEVAAGRFRSDLFYRLNVFAFVVPPLRDRAWSVPLLIRGFIDEFDTRSGQASHQVSPEAQKALMAYDWPGNIRELRNVIERAVALCPGSSINLDDLPTQFHPPEPLIEPPAPGFPAPWRSP